MTVTITEYALLSALANQVMPGYLNEEGSSPLNDPAEHLNNAISLTSLSETGWTVDQILTSIVAVAESYA